MSKTEDLLRQLEQANKFIADQKYALDRAAIVAITDSRGVITYVNEKFCDISGFTSEELVGNTHSLISSRHHSQEFFANMWKAIGNGMVWQGEICNQAKGNGLYWVDTTIIPFLDTNNRPYQYIAIRYDITRKKKAEESLEIERSRLFESEKMASLGLLSSGISHELGNPLGALRGRLEMLERLAKKEEPIDPKKIFEGVHKMVGLVDRMSQIIRGLGAYARDDSQDPFEKVDICHLVADIVEISRDRCRKNSVRVNIKGVEGEFKVRGRQAELGQVMVNLLNNAVDAVKSSEERWVEISFHREDLFIEIRFKDSGEGVSLEKVSKIFDPFFTTKPVGEGTGLGLSICKSIVESHSGTLNFLGNKPNTCFSVRLPLYGLG